MIQKLETHSLVGDHGPQTDVLSGTVGYTPLSHPILPTPCILSLFPGPAVLPQDFGVVCFLGWVFCFVVLLFSCPWVFDGFILLFTQVSTHLLGPPDYLN